MGDQLVEIRNLTKRFGPFTAVDGISFSLERGEVLGFLGPNGAGKSTTMKMITGFLSPTGGTAVVCGHDVLTSPIEVKRRIGYLPEGAPAYPDMTPETFLRFVGQIRGLRGADLRRRVDEAAAKTHLEGVWHQPIETLSKGFKRRVGLAQAILNDPEVLILDEPTDGLDPNQKFEVRSLIKEMAAEKAIILSTHILEEVDAVCTRATVISSGRIVADGTPAQLEERSRYHNAVRLRLTGVATDAAKKELGDLAEVGQIEAIESELEGAADLRVFAKNGSSIVGAVSAVAREKNWKIAELHVERGRLDEVFRSITTSDTRSDAEKQKA